MVAGGGGGGYWSFSEYGPGYPGKKYDPDNVGNGQAGVVEKSGSWFSYDSQRIGQGRENAKTFLRENPDMAASIEKAVRANAGLLAAKILDADGGGEDTGESPGDDEGGLEAMG